MENTKRNSFKGSIGFVLAAAGSAVGLGNIWRFPYLAAKHGGGLFLVIYIILALTFGFALLTTEIAIGRKTKQSPLTAYSKINKKWGWLGGLACIVPIIILPYYCVIGGWVLKYFITFLTGQGVASTAEGYFTSFISSANGEPILMLLFFLIATAFVVFRGVNKGIESFSKIVMPALILLVIGIAVFSLTLSHTDKSGETRTGMDGFLIYLVPNVSELTIGKFFSAVVDAMGQLFYSLSVAMGIMITYGSYVRDEDNLGKSINQIEIFDTVVAFLAGVMIVPAVYAFSGYDGLSASGPSLMFISLPNVFAAMGPIGNVIGCLFFAMVLFAALTSSVSLLEAIVSCFMDKFKIKRPHCVGMVTAITLVIGVVVCLGYNLLYFDFTLPNGAVGQILDIMDYLSNNILMPVVSIGTCLLIGWIAKPKTVIDEVEKSGVRMGRKVLYIVMVKFVVPILLLVLLLKSLGLNIFN